MLLCIRLNFGGVVRYLCWEIANIGAKIPLMGSVIINWNIIINYLSLKLNL